MESVPGWGHVMFMLKAAQAQKHATPPWNHRTPTAKNHSQLYVQPTHTPIILESYEVIIIV